MLTWTTPDGVRISSERPVNDWSFPFTPESGVADLTWAQAPCGATCAASKEMNTKRNNVFPAAEIIFRSRCPAPEAATSEVLNSFLLLKIWAFESRHVNLIVSPSKMALTLMCLRCDSFLNRRPARPSSVIEPDSDRYGS